MDGRLPTSKGNRVVSLAGVQIVAWVFVLRRRVFVYRSSLVVVVRFTLLICTPTVSPLPRASGSLIRIVSVTSGVVGFVLSLTPSEAAEEEHEHGEEE